MEQDNDYQRDDNEMNSSVIIEQASERAALRLMKAHNKPFEEFVEPDEPDDPESGTHYKEEYQDEFDRYYDEEYDRCLNDAKQRHE